MDIENRKKQNQINQMDIENRRKQNQINQMDIENRRKQNQINQISNNKWYCFGKMSRKRKVWIIGKILSKKLKLYWLIQTHN